MFIVEKFRERNKKYKDETQKKFAQKNLDTQQKHEKKMEELIKLNLEKAKEAEEKSFGKYITFYFQRKAIERSFRDKKQKRKNKLQEKTERIEELEKNNEKKRKGLVKKLNDMKARREKFEMEKEEKLSEEKKERDKKYSSCLIKKQELLMEQNQRRQDILDFQYDILKRALKKDNINELKRINASEKTVINQMTLEKNLNKFHSRMSRLKSESVLKMTPEARLKIYKDLKREEAEKKKKELEEKLLAKQ